MRNVCSIDGCGGYCWGQGLCSRHYQQVRRHGKTFRSKFDPNTFIIKNEVCEIVILNKHMEEAGRTIVDLDMQTEVKLHKWHLSHGYAVASTGLQLHHLVFGKPMKGFEVDHVNRRILDNRRSNLRFVTSSQNKMNTGLRRDNTSGFAGLYWNKRDKNWNVRIVVDGKCVHLGNHKNKQKAITIRRQAEQQYFGKYAFSKV